MWAWLLYQFLFLVRGAAVRYGGRWRQKNFFWRPTEISSLAGLVVMSTCFLYYFFSWCAVPLFSLGRQNFFWKIFFPTIFLCMVLVWGVLAFRKSKNFQDRTDVGIVKSLSGAFLEKVNSRPILGFFCWNVSVGVCWGCWWRLSYVMVLWAVIFNF